MSIYKKLLFKADCGHIVKKHGLYGVSKIDGLDVIDLCWPCLGRIETIESNNLLSDLMFKNIEDEQSYSKTDREQTL